jgi:hypothetical protein
MDFAKVVFNFYSLDDLKSDMLEPEKVKRTGQGFFKML